MRPLSIGKLLATAIIAAAMTAPAPAPAWEATTTHAGLSEQAAIVSTLHRRLRDHFGLEQGLYTSLTIPPADAPGLFAVMRKLNPTHGYVPDARGRLFAMGWLVAGSVIANNPVTHAGNHFFDPSTGKGIDGSTITSTRDRIRHNLITRVFSERSIDTGIAATDWAVADDNPMNLAGFIDQYGKAVRTSTPGERSRHIAGALMAAGALLHLIQDMGSPSHVRNDLAAHLDPVGNDDSDVGSRFERVAALAYGRLGVPAASSPVVATSLRGFFTAEDGSGLADRSARNWFSAHTLPRPTSLPRKLKHSSLSALINKSLHRPLPAPSADLDLIAAPRAAGAELSDTADTCIARYHVDGGVLRWSLDDKCILEQLAVILPEVGGYSTGLLDWLFRGSATIRTVDNHLVATVNTATFGAGMVEFLCDDERGVRSAHHQLETGGGAPGDALGQAPMPPATCKRVTVLFTGVDSHGTPLVATGTSRYPISKNK